MFTIYLNNYRGFEKTFIKLKDVNFLVGENSTGKTSLLKILRCLLKKDFWFSNLELTEADLGFYSEICSEGTGNSTFFQIGIEFSQNDVCYLLTYNNKNGFPIIKNIEILINQSSHDFQFEPKSKVKYRKSTFETNNNDSKFKDWINSNLYHQEKAQTFDLKSDGFMPILYQLYNISRTESHEDEILEVNHFFLPYNIQPVFWSSPIRSSPKRVYDSPFVKHNPDGSHTPYILKDLVLNAVSENEKIHKKKIETILNKFGEDSGMFERINLTQYEMSNDSPFRIQIQIDGKNRNITNVGYGVSQILPLLIEISLCDKNTVFAIQQPEVHLHPRGQASFGDFILKSYIMEEKTFLIETHSDYLIDRFRIKLNENQNNSVKCESQILFFTKSMNGNHVQAINIRPDGSIDPDQPKEYRDFFFNEQIDLINL